MRQGPRQAAGVKPARSGGVGQDAREVEEAAALLLEAALLLPSVLLVQTLLPFRRWRVLLTRPAGLFGRA